MFLNIPFTTWLPIFTFAGPFLVALAVALYDLLLQHLPEARRAQVEQLVATVVAAVEQRDQGAPGPVKKANALAAIHQVLAAWHLPVPDVLVEMLLESAVAALPPTVQSVPVVPVTAGTSDVKVPLVTGQ